MKSLYLIGGTMGIGKTTVCQRLKEELKNSVFLDGDWCWDASPFQVTDETKKMVMENIVFLLNQFLHCNAYENVIFCWVMHRQEILDELISGIDTRNCEVKQISLVGDVESLRSRLMRDVQSGIRKQDIIDRSLERMQYYDELHTIKIDTSDKSIDEVLHEILELK